MLAKFADHVSQTLEEIKAQGLYKTERIITGPQNAEIPIADGRRVINLCANNYLGLADHPALIAAAKEALDSHGFGMASVRFICGTQDIHKELEAALTKFLGTEDTILYPSCFDANGGLFETLLGAEDAVISDELNHASIIDGVRLCKAQRYRYKNCDMADLEAQLQAAQRRALPSHRDRWRFLDGRHDREPERRLRPGGKIRCDGDGGRRPRRRVHRQNRARHAGTLRRAGPDRRDHGNVRQSARRRERRLHQRAQRDRRAPPATFAALSFLQYGRAADRRRVAQGARAFDRARPSCATSWRRTRNTSAPP